MKTLPVGEFKSKFSEVLENVKKRDEIAISFGKKKEKIAMSSCGHSSSAAIHGLRTKSNMVTFQLRPPSPARNNG